MTGTAPARGRLPIVASWSRLRIGSIQVVHTGPRSESIEQPVMIVRIVTKADYVAQWPGEMVPIRGRFFYEVTTD